MINKVPYNKTHPELFIDFIDVGRKGLPSDASNLNLLQLEELGGGLYSCMAGSTWTAVLKNSIMVTNRVTKESKRLNTKASCNVVVAQ